MLAVNQDDTCHAIQIKTKQLINGPLKIKDPAIMNSLIRFVKLSKKFPQKFSNFIIVSNCPFRDDDSSKSLVNLLNQVKKVEPEELSPRGLKECINDLILESEASIEEVISVLKNTEVQIGPSMDDIDARVINDHVGKLKACEDQSIERIRLIYRLLCEKIFSASSKHLENGLKDYYSLIGGIETLQDEEINNKRITIGTVAFIIDNSLKKHSTINSKVLMNDNPSAGAEGLKSFENFSLQKIEETFCYENRPNAINSKNLILTDDPLLCIDFGTSYTLVTIKDIFSNTYFIPDIKGNTAIPTIIEIFENGTYSAGSSVSSHYTNSSFIVKNIKRLVLLNKYYSIGNKKISITSLIALFFRSLYRNAYEYLGRPVSKILLSIPTDFGVTEKEIIEKGAERAGFTISRSIQEASSTALLISSFEQAKSIQINIDLGGGTLDISISEVGDGLCEILYTLGNKSLGSIDFDFAIRKYIQNEIENKYGLSSIMMSDSLCTQIEKESERIKIMLNSQETVSLIFECLNGTNGNVIYYDLEITKDKFIEITEYPIQQIKEMLLKLKVILSQDNFHLRDKSIYLTGQGTKLFLIKNLIKEMFPKYSIIDKYEESAVALGLSIQSGIMCGVTKGKILLDNSHIYMDVLCNRYEKENDTIYFSAENNFYFNILSPIKESKDGQQSRSIPDTNFSKISFDSIDGKAFEISFFETNPNDGRKNYLKSLFFNPEIMNIYYIKTHIDNGGNIDMIICTEDEMNAFKQMESAQFKAFLSNISLK
nr:Hsp70 family protein [Paenibacillus xylanexedens]